MSTLGNSTTPATGFFFDHTGNSQFWSGTYTMPAGGGVMSDIYVYCAGDGSSVTGQLVVWGSSSILYQSGNITLSSGSESIGGQAWQHVGSLAVYIPAGTVNLGFWSSGNVVWTYESSGSTNFQRSLSSGPGSLSSGGTDGSGALGAYITYTPGGVAYVNTGTPGSPTWTQGIVYVNTGTSGSPVWTPAPIAVNTGTPGSPVWTPGS